MLFVITSWTFAGETGKIAGTVKDQATGERLPGINIIIQGTTLGAASDIDGNFIINNIPPGTYTVIVSGVGYQKTTFTNVKVASDFTTNLDVDLATDVIAVETIVVQADAPMVRKDLTSSQSTIDAETIGTLPVESVNQILTLQAGIIEGASGELHIKGGRSSEISYTINGVSVANPYDNTRSVQISPNAIQELSVVSGTFNAEYGNALSGIVNTITKEGQRTYTGSISAYTGDYISSRDKIFYNIDDVDPVSNYVGEFTFGGPIPALGEYITFFASGRYDNNGGYLYGIRQHSPQDQISYKGTDSMLVPATGDGKVVSMNPSEDLNGTLKLTFKPSSAIKINYDVVYNNSEYQFYNHNLKYNPDANYHRFSYGLLNSLEFRHVLSNTTFYTLKGSYNISDFKRYLYPLLGASGNEVDYTAGDDISAYHADPRYLDMNSAQSVANFTFSSGGTLNEHFYQHTATSNGKFDITSQVTKNHEVKAGAELKVHVLDLEDFDVTRENGVVYIPSSNLLTHNVYTKKPYEFSAYVQDKMEFENIILNPGLRYDYFTSDSYYSVDPQNPSPNNPNIISGVDKGSLLKKTSGKHQLSPRIGISFPITDKGIIHFSYGHFFQMPPFSYLYANSGFKWEVSGTPTFGNADLDPERTVTYEIGLQQQLADNLSIDVTAYAKDVRDLLALEEIRLNTTQTYYKYVNKDYANIKGITFSLNKRRGAGEIMGASIDYTFQVAEGSDTRSDAAFFDYASGKMTEKVPYNLDWDQHHTLNASVNFGQTSSWDVTFVARLGSGLPYTPQLLEEQVALRTNSARKPSQLRVDLLAEKSFKIMSYNLVVFLKVFNLFDSLIENDVYDDTGRSGYTLESTRGNTQSADAFARQNPLIKPSSEYFVRPDYYLAPREVRMGLSIEF
jgi:outer membrane receptor protein involved in Fe transport